MFGTIRRHQKWLWWFVVAVVIVSFVVYFDPSQQSSSGRDRSGSGLGEIDGRPITAQEFRDARQETRLLYFLNFRKWPEEDDRQAQMNFDIERETYFRLLRVAKVKEAGIRVSDETVGMFAKRLLGDYPLAEFTKTILQSPAGRMTTEDFERFVRNDAGIQQLSALVGAAGKLVTPAEAEIIYRRERQELAGEIVFFNLSNYLGRVAVTNEALGQWYTNHMAQYRTPEQISVRYVEFARSNFVAEADKQLATVSNLNARLQEVYYKEGTNNFKDTNGNVLSASAAIEKIKEIEGGKLAMFFARKKANEFANHVYDEFTKKEEQKAGRADVLEGVAAAEGFKVEITPPFDRDEGPTNLNLMVPPRLWSSLSAENPIAFQPIEGEGGFYVVALKDVIPSRIEPYEAVQQKVLEDYKRTQAFTLSRQEAMDFQTALTNALAAGKTFSEVAAQAKVPSVTLPPISPMTESLTNFEHNVNVRQLRQVMFSLDPGKSSGYIPNPPEGGYIVYVRAKLPMDEAKLKTELPKFLGEVRYYKQNEIFGQWFRREVERAKLPLTKKNAAGAPAM